jgi:thymidylate kinase
MEREDDSYHQKVRRAYLQLARRAKKRIKVLDGEKSIEELKSEVLRHVQDLLNRKGYTL